MAENGTPQSNNHSEGASSTLDTDAKAEGCLASWRETLVVTASFMAAYNSFLALQSLQSSLNQEAGLGVVSLACLYGTLTLSGILTPSFLRLVGAKWSLVIAWICHGIYTASNFYPSWATLIPASILLGAILGPQWVSQGLYTTATGKRIAKKSGKSLHASLSKVNGIFFMCYESTQITGNLISSLVLNQGSYTESDSVNLMCGVDDCPASSNATVIEKPEPRIVNILIGVYFICDVVALVLTLFLLPPLNKSEDSNEKTKEDKGLRKALVAWFTALSDPKLLLLVVCFISSAMSQGVLFAYYTKSFISCYLGVSTVGFIMASFGAATSVVSTVLSRAAEYTGRYFLFGLSFVCNMSLLLALLLWKPNSDSYAKFFIIASIWGIAVAIFHTQFNKKTPAAYANYHTWSAIGFAITFAYGGAASSTSVSLCSRLA